MLFLVPDDSEDPRGADSMLDTSETSRAAQKVDLDLDDAPFLEEEEEVKPEAPAPKPSVSMDEPEEPKPPRDKKKLIIIGAGALLLIIALAVAAKLLFFKGKAEKPAEPQQQAEPLDEDNGTDNATAAVPETLYRLDPFWVEQKAASDDEVRFLIVRIMLGSQDPAAARDLESKLLPARNAIFYYLKNKDVQFLADEANAERLKKELLLVVNQYVADTKFDSLMFEEYVVK